MLPTAYNLNYQENPTGYPMPKDLEIDGAEVAGNSKWLNAKYQQIRSNPRISKFYHSFVGRFLDMQKQTTGKQLGYNLPGYEQNSLNDVANKGVKEGVKNQAKMFRDKNIAIGTDYDFSINGYGTNEDDRIQFKHNTPLPIDAIPDDDDDDADLAKTLLYNIVAVYAKVDMETRSMVPMIIIGDLDGYLQNFTSFTNLGRDVGNIFKMLDHGFSLGMANIVDETSAMGEFFDKRAYYQRNTKLFDKGEAKIKKDIMNLTGYMNLFELFEPEDRFKNYKSKLNI